LLGFGRADSEQERTDGVAHVVDVAYDELA
jgi:hypothetical protein